MRPYLFFSFSSVRLYLINPFVDFGVECGVDIVYAAFAFDQHYLVELAVVVGHGGGFFVVFGYAGMDNIFPGIVAPAGGKAAVEQAFDEFFFGYVQRQHHVDGGAFLLQQGVERFRLGFGSREPVEQEAAGFGIVYQGMVNHTDNYLVGHQLALVHQAFSSQAQGGLTGYFAA